MTLRMRKKTRTLGLLTKNYIFQLIVYLPKQDAGVVEVAGISVYPKEQWLQLAVSVAVLLQVAHPELPAVQVAETIKHIEQSNTIVIEINNKLLKLVISLVDVRGSPRGGRGYRTFPPPPFSPKLFNPCLHFGF